MSEANGQWLRWTAMALLACVGLARADPDTPGSQPFDCKKYLPTTTQPPSDLDPGDLYQKRGERCEGIYAPGTSRALDARIELMGTVLGTARKTPETAMTLEWECGAAHVRVVAVEKLKYQMDVQASSPYVWPTDVLRRLTLAPERLAAVAISGGDRLTYCPVRIRELERGDEAAFRFKAAEKLKDIKATLRAGSTTTPVTATRQGPTRQFTVKVARQLLTAGAVLQIQALIDDGASGTATSADFYLGADK